MSLYLLLESKNMRDTSINGVLKPGLSFIRDCNGGLAAFAHREVSKEFGDITSTKNLVNGCKMGSSLFMAEVRSKNTAPHTFPPQEFASTTRRARACHLFLIDLMSLLEMNFALCLVQRKH